MGRPAINHRSELAGKKIAFVGDGGLNDFLVQFIIQRLEDASIFGLRSAFLRAMNKSLKPC